MALTKYKNVTDYNTAVELLNGKDQKKIAHNTTLVNLMDVYGFIGVRYWNTYIVKYYPDRTELDTAGYDTYTTKERINIFSNAMVYQKDFIWYMADGTLFYDGIVI